MHDMKNKKVFIDWTSVEMEKFNNKTYEALAKDLINDAFYLEQRSRRGTIATIRQYSEIIVRRVLDLPCNEFVTIGNKNILKELEKRSNNNPILLDSLKRICAMGNKSTHTQEIAEITEEDLKEVIDNLFNLYSYLLIDFFERYSFGSNLEIVSSFSILPPIIRYKTLKYLNDRYPENLLILDKLSLAILKAFDRETAVNWIEKRKELLENTSSVSEKAKLNIIEKMGNELASIVISDAPNMYQLCLNRINSVANTIESKGKLYDDFESAITLYCQEGIIKGDASDVIEFNSVMEFLYLGRKAKKNQLLEEKEEYLLIDTLF